MWQEIPPAAEEIRERIVEPSFMVFGGVLEGLLSNKELILLANSGWQKLWEDLESERRKACQPTCQQ